MPQEIDPNQDFDTQLRALVAEEIAKTQKAPETNTPPAPQPLKLNIAGQEMTYENLQQLEAAVNNFAQTAAQRIQQLSTPAPTQTANVQGDDAPAWSDEAFIEKMTKAPKEGFNYALNQLIFDGRSEDAATDLKTMLRDAELTKRSIAAYQFKDAHPEFPGGAQFATAIDQIREKMNLPYDYTGLEAAYLMGINKGLLPNFYSQQQQMLAQQQNQQQQLQQQGSNFQGQPSLTDFNPYSQAAAQNPYLQAPPQMGRSQATPFNPGFDPESLDLGQLEAILKKTGQM